MIDSRRGFDWWGSAWPSGTCSRQDGSSLPSSESTTSTRLPAKRSMAPHSSMWMWEVPAQTTAWYASTAPAAATTLAAVPLKTRWVTVSGPKT